MDKDGAFIVVVGRPSVSIPHPSPKASLPSLTFFPSLTLAFPLSFSVLFALISARPLSRSILPRMVPQINVGVSTVIRFGLGLCFAASVMAFDMSLNTNVCLLTPPILVCDDQVFFSLAGCVGVFSVSLGQCNLSHSNQLLGTKLVRRVKPRQHGQLATTH